MKVLSILQPWASLIVLGHKRIETRSWLTKYTGPLLIHASAGKNPTSRYLAENDFSSYLPKALHKVKRGKNIDVSYTHYHNLPFGAIIGSCNLGGWFETNNLFPEYEYYINNVTHKITEQEREMGNYDYGRFGWVLNDIVKFDKPIPAKGSLGIWNWEREQLSPKIMHASFSTEPSNETVKALNAMAELAFFKK